MVEKLNVPEGDRTSSARPLPPVGLLDLADRKSASAWTTSDGDSQAAGGQIDFTKHSVPGFDGQDGAASSEARELVSSLRFNPDGTLERGVKLSLQLEMKKYFPDSKKGDDLAALNGWVGDLNKALQETGSDVRFKVDGVKRVFDENGEPRIKYTVSVGDGKKIKDELAISRPALHR